MSQSRNMAMVLLSLGALVASANGQSASLYVTAPARPVAVESGLAAASLTAVVPPRPREPQIHDLITVIVKDESSYSTDANQSGDKKLKVDGGVDSWVRFDGTQSIVPLTFEGGNPAVKADLNASNESTGAAKRKDKVLARITARIIDVKPNGTVVLEARKSIKADEETISMTLTGMCRKQDISATNTVTSDQVYDLNVVAKYGGSVKDSTRKGWLTRLVEILSPF
jgi:flagellar L-ring protein precursor FlgH